MTVLYAILAVIGWSWLLVVTAFTLTLLLRRPLLRAPDERETRPIKALAWLSIGLWCAVIICGRWIAYTI